MALTKKRPASIPTALRVRSQGELVKFDVTYHNRNADEFEAQLSKGSMTDLVLFVVESWDSEYALDTAGVEEMERDRPGLILAIIQGYHQARRAALEKN